MIDKAAATADLTSLVKNLQYASKTIEESADDLIRETASKVKSIAVTKAPIRTGALRESISVHYGRLSATIGPGVEYGVYQEFGTASMGEFGGQPYVIRPKNGKYLVFTINGRKVFAKKVTHPGVKPKYYMRGALESVLQPFIEELAEIGALKIVKGKNAKP